ncbi:hypothetical protein BDZ89DRAFT_1062683 [Hymenopellis radicata]|nr:hypothetical protein BDZ89DRAFT_1062683 [Hymenopellis radicata]
MSSDESDSDQLPRAGPSKRKRLQGACDACRKKKSDSANMPDNCCTNCRALGIICAHRHPVKVCNPTSLLYVVTLEKRVANLEAMLRQLQPNVKMNSEVSPQSSASPPSDVGGGGEGVGIDDEADLEYIELMDQIANLRLVGISDNYFGPSSNLYFMRKVLEMRGDPPAKPMKLHHGKNWDTQHWELATVTRHHQFTFPESDLFSQLLDLYFLNFHRYLPLLHQPTFRHDIEVGRYLHDRPFAIVALLVCALGARFSDDQRVFVEGAPQLSAGWKWFVQVTMIPRSPFEHPNLLLVQECCLSAEYLSGTSAPQVSWTKAGLGLRYCIEMGYHRFRPELPTVENELKRRAFWCSYILDRHTSFYHGRPSAIRDEDFDVEMPIECDDEYWEATVPFTQPYGKPSRIHYLNLHIKLCQIMSFAVRTLFSIRKSKEAVGLVGNWAQSNVAVLDSMLNKWFDSIPPYLRWDPQRDPDPFLDESAALYCTYYNMQIQIHRPFISRASALSLPSLALCTNAARSCARLLEVRHKRGPITYFGMAMAGFASGIVLSLNMWTKTKDKALAGQPPREVEDLYRCMRVLDSSEKRYNICGRLVDSLQACSNLPFPFEQETQSSRPHASYAHPQTADYGASTDADAPPALVQSSWSAPATDFGVLPTRIDILVDDPVFNINFAQAEADMSMLYDPGMMANDALKSWSNTPMFNWNDWGGYIPDMEGAPQMSQQPVYPRGARW